MEHQLCSDFSVGKMNVAFMHGGCFQQLIGGQCEDSFGESGTDETPQARKRRGGSSTARGKRSLARKLTAM
ncbi:hypothetical protein R7236_16155 [Priestia megaterium]|uniref:hypothetical protein n=1 Tax=Priestia megaterium TaxID=1404 RepID=UPI000BED1B06|nr:hypothetical protein [Priestia megaterium]MDW4509937.1 hypothetical protein [Priestia megaterium]PEC44833.1 hypothetical protein CON11_06225 [Priestia megaterium]